MSLCYGGGFIFLFILIIYFLPNHKFFSRPYYLIVLGFCVCVIAAIFTNLATLISSKFPDMAKDSNIYLLQQIFSFSFASLGGGIISAGFMVRLQIEHITQKEDLLKRREFLEKDLLDLDEGLKAAKESSNQELINLCMTEIYLNKRELRKINDELSRMSKL